LVARILPGHPGVDIRLDLLGLPAVTRFHVHAIVRDLQSDDEIASVTVSLNADDDGEAQKLAWELFDQDTVTVDVTEIEEADA
jgi:hypothetical protein